MAFDPTRCEDTRFTKRRPIHRNYTIHGHTLKIAQTGKYLGVTPSEKLSWNQHIVTTTQKANNSLAFLRRIFSSCPRQIKAQCYETLVRPTQEYDSTFWDPYTQRNIKEVEAVQRRATRFVIGDYRYTSSPSQMIELFLLNRRSNAKLFMVYRITYELIDISAASYLHPTSINTRGHSLHYMVTYCHTENYSHSFLPSGTFN